MILKQLISCFFTTLTLMVKGKASSTKPPNHDAFFSENKSSYVYIVTNKTKVTISLTKRYLIQQRDLMHPVSMLEPKKKCGTKYCEIKVVKRKPKIARIAKLEITNENNFIDIAKLKNINSK